MLNRFISKWAIGPWKMLIYLIKYESTSGGSPFSTSETFQRFEASTQVRVQAIYVFEANGAQVNISDSILLILLTLRILILAKHS